MPTVDIIILTLLSFGGLIGFRRGFIKQTVISGGLILIIILSFILKNPISIFMYENLPFFSFKGIFFGISTLNILIYEIISFILVLSILLIIFKILIKITSLIERILDFTIILGIPSKILGALMGIIEAYVWIFIILFILNLPHFNIEYVNESNFKEYILNNTPVLSKYADKTVSVATEIYSLKDEFIEATDSDEFNLKVLDVMLKHNIITVSSAEKLYASGKLIIPGINLVLDKYR